MHTHKRFLCIGRSLVDAEMIEIRNINFWHHAKIQLAEGVMGLMQC